MLHTAVLADVLEMQQLGDVEDFVLYWSICFQDLFMLWASAIFSAK